MFNDLLKGRLNQKNRTLHVQSTFGRDVQDTAMDTILGKLQAWDDKLAAAQAFMEQQMDVCTKNVHDNYNNQVTSEVKYQKELNRAVINLRKNEEGRNAASE